jgi:hypothetical protein
MFFVLQGDSLFVRLSIVGQGWRTVKQKDLGKFLLHGAWCPWIQKTPKALHSRRWPVTCICGGVEEKDMKRFSNWTSLFLLGGLMLTAAATRANADAWNKKTYVTINRSIEVPGAVLQPGKYVFKLVDSASNRHIVQILNADENRVLATNLAIPKQRDNPPDKTILTFYEMPGGGPEPVRAWFYPGDTIGQEFLYSRNRATQIAQATRQDVPVMAQAEQAAPTTVATASETTAPATSIPVTEGANQQQSVAVNSEPSPAISDAVVPAPYTEPEVEASQEPAPAAATAPANPAPVEPAMPRTASNLFAAGMLGLGCLGIAATLGASRHRRGE